MTNPKYILIAAVTIDGKIAKHSRHMTDWTSKEDKEFMRAQLDKCDVIVVGNNTYKTALEPLSKRNCIVFTESIKSTMMKSLLCLYLNPKTADIQEIIKKNNYKTVCILGGMQTYTYFLEKGLIDELYITVEPIIFGKGLSLFNTPVEEKNFELVSVKKLNDSGTILIYYRKRSK